jgi:hypothetical protein
MTTPNELISLLVDARNTIKLNSAALAVVNLDVMDDVRPSLYENARMIATIDKAINEFYADET